MSDFFNSEIVIDELKEINESSRRTLCECHHEVGTNE